MFGLFSKKNNRDESNNEVSNDIDDYGNLSDEYLDKLTDQQLELTEVNEWAIVGPIDLLALNIEKQIDFRAKHYLEAIYANAENLVETINLSIELFDSEASEPLNIDKSINEFNDNQVRLRKVFEKKLNERRDKLSDSYNARYIRIEIILYERLIYHSDGISMYVMPYLKEYDKRYNPSLSY